MAKRRKVSNLLALSLLTLLTQRPMYPYEMASTLRERGKDNAIKINWGSFYTVVQNLEKYGFIEAIEVVREGRQPERTTYQITDAGRAELMDWLRELLSVPEREHSSFEAALGESAVLPPDELIDLLQQRLARSRRPTAVSRLSWPPWSPRYPGCSSSNRSTTSRSAGPRRSGYAGCSRSSPAAHSPAWRPGGASTRPARSLTTCRRSSSRKGEARPTPDQTTPAWCGNTGGRGRQPQVDPASAEPEVPPSRVAGFLLAGLDRRDP